MRNYIIAILLPVISVLYAGSLSAQNAPEKTAPFTAVKWLQSNPYVMVEDEWYLLVTLQGTDAATIVSFCKKEYGSKWQKRFSEDLVVVMQKMGKPLPMNVKMVLVKDSKNVTKTKAMTKDNRKAALAYNNGNPPAEKAGSKEEVVKQVQKDIAGFANTTMEKPFTCRSAKIEFTYTGHKLYAGKETMYIDDYGNTVVLVTDKPGVMGQKENNTIIWKDNKTTHIDHTKKTWYTTPVRTKSTEPPVISYSTETQRKQGGYIKQSNESVAGKNCMVYKHKTMNVTYWLWKNIDVKLINYAAGGNMGYTKEATGIQENITIPSKLFEIPAGYKKR